MERRVHAISVQRITSERVLCFLNLPYLTYDSLSISMLFKYSHLLFFKTNEKNKTFLFFAVNFLYIRGKITFSYFLLIALVNLGDKNFWEVFNTNKSNIAKLGERPTILDSHSDKVLKDFNDQKRDEKMYKKVWSDISVYNTINRDLGKRLGEVVVGTRTLYCIEYRRLPG